MRTTLFMLILAGLLTGSAPMVNPVVIDGTIDRKLADRLIPQISDGTIIDIRSYGGEADSSIDLADRISQHNVTVRVREYCLSACAELIVPAAKTIIMIGEPLIGFHGNAMTYQYLLEKEELPELAKCEEVRSDKFREIYRRRNIKMSSWDKQIKLVGIYYDSSQSDKQDKTCSMSIFSSKYKYWFPTSVQLRNDFGWKFDGEVCADAIECARTSIKKYWYPGNAYVVGISTIKY